MPQSVISMQQMRCIKAFKSNTDHSQNVSEGSNNDAFCKVLHDMFAIKSRMWNDVDIEELYKSHGEKLLSNKIISLIYCSVMCWCILVSRQEASKHRKLVVNNEDDRDTTVERVVKVIVKKS